MAAHPNWPARVLQKYFDVLLAALLAILTVGFSAQHGNWAAAAVDVIAFLVAAFTSRWPRPAGAALAIVLGISMFLPAGWPSLAEYAALIPILATGIRGQREERLWMTAVYGTLLAAWTYRDSQGHPAWPFAIAAWAVLIGTMWVIGDLFTSYRRALDQAQDAWLQGQRIELARDLHDTVARELTRASLRVQTAREQAPSSELDAALAGIQRASTELRWMLSLLRDEVSHSRATSWRPEKPTTHFFGALDQLRTHGFTVESTVDGDLDAIPATAAPTLQAVIGEMCANIERHASSAEPCSIVVSVSDDAIDTVFINAIPPPEAIMDAGHQGIGIACLHERLAVVGGEMHAERAGTQWVSTARIPI